MYIHVVDVNKDRIFFLLAFLDLQSIRDNETTTSKKLIFFNALTYVPIIQLLQGKHELKLRTLANNDVL